MPFEKIDGLVTTATTISGTTNYDYNLQNVNTSHGDSGKPAYGLSVQAVYSSGTGVIKLQCSNDGTHFADISGATVSFSASGNTMWDLGTPFYKILRVNVVISASTPNLTLIYNAVNAA